MYAIHPNLPADLDSPEAAALTAAGTALVGAARAGHKIWICCASSAREDAEEFVRGLGSFPVIVLPATDPATLERLGEEGDILLLWPGSSFVPLATAGHGLRMRVIGFAGAEERRFFTAFDLPLPAHAVARDLSLLALIVARDFTGRQTQKVFHDWEVLRAAVDGLRPLVFTNGVFDILHRGHVHSLQEARAHGAYLIVGINSDSSVKRLGKGDDRPIQSEEDRAAILATLSCVDFVTIFDEDTPTRLIEAVEPDWTGP